MTQASLGAALPERFIVCKEYVGATGPAVNVNVQVDIDNNGSIDQNFNVSIADGTCQQVWIGGGATFDSVVVTETAQNGFTPTFIKSVIVGGVTTVDPMVSGTQASGLVRGDTGTLIEFINTLEDTPPPPTGNQGCTPGYWKQPHHFDSWTAPYTPDTLFSAVFENAFPGMTLADVLGQGGGGLKALGRHTVAALLNAQSNQVGYPMTTAEVIAAFNDVFPSGNLNGLHVQLARFNEAGCPLN